MTRPRGLPAYLCPCGCEYVPWPGLSYTRRSAITAAVELTYGRICWLCKRPIGPGEFSTDHVVPDSKHGGHDLANLRPAHARCNSARGNRPRKPSLAWGYRQSWIDD